MQYLARYKTWKNWRDQRNSDDYRAVQMARLPTPDTDDEQPHVDDRAPPYRPSDQSRTSVTIPRPLNIANSIVPSGPPSPTESRSSQESIPTSNHQSPTPPPPVKSGRSSQTSSSSNNNNNNNSNNNSNNKITKNYSRCLRSRTRLSPSARHFFELDSRGRPRTVEQSPMR